MSLRTQAENDLAFIVEDVNGFGWTIQLTDPSGYTATGPLVGLSNDISQIIDPDTGQVVSGRSASVALRISTLVSKGYSLPRNIADNNSKPWLVRFDDINGNPYTFKIRSTDPDRALGLIVCTLEAYAA